MPIDTSMYQNVGNFRQPEVPSFADAAAKGMNLKSMAMQQKQMGQKMAADEESQKMASHLQKASVFGNTLESLSGLPEQERAAAYPKARAELLAAGVLKPEDAPEQYDPGFYRQSLMRFQGSKEGIERQMQALQMQKTKAEINKMNSEAKTKNSPTGMLTEGQKSVDKDYAKDYNTFTQKGAVNAKVAIDRLGSLADELEKDTGMLESGGGRFASALPDALRSRDAIRRRDQARNFANTTLKELFGGQLSDGERQAAAKEYYNDALGNAENAKIIRDKIDQLKSGYESEVAKAKYYEQNGTLLGFRGVPASTNQMVAQPKRSSGSSGSWDGMSSANAAPPDSGVRMQGPDGAVRVIPESMVGEAIAAGGKRIK